MAPEIALLTGCGSGIGKELAKKLDSKKLESGEKQFKVYATDYRDGELQDLAKLGISTIKMDVRDMQNVLQVVDDILKKHGHIDLLSCNAEISPGGFLAETDYDEVERVFDVNLHGTFRTVQAVAPHMLAARSGKIATTTGVNAYTTQPFQGAFCGSKGAIDRMSESLCMELDPFGVSVTSVIPGYVNKGLEAIYPTNFSRYESQDSYYHSAIENVKKWAAKYSSRGSSPEEAAHSIAEGLSQKKPPRYVYTGQSTWRLLFYAFCSFFFMNGYAAYRSIVELGLSPLFKESKARKKALSKAKGQEEVPLLVRKQN